MGEQQQRSGRNVEDASQPFEVSAAPGNRSAYIHYRVTDALHTPYRLPYQYVAGIKKGLIKKPEAPLIVFINARSGGGDGPALALTLSRAVGRAQVFDISENRPADVLKKMWQNFEEAEQRGDQDASLYRQRLRIIVAGGDGTIAWVLATIKKFNLNPPPGVAIIPLGTGNDMSRSFGWGGEFIRSSIQDYDRVYCMLMRVATAKLDTLDCWNISVQLPHAGLKSPLPHCLAYLEHEKPSAGAQQPVAAKGMFWNYLSVGLDAQAAYGFHTLREAHPALTAGQLSNQWWYSWFSCSSGWFCGAKPVVRKAKLSILPPGGNTWTEVKLKDDVRAIVLLNLQSYGGGRSLWGTAPLNKKQQEAGLKSPSYNDGLLEVVGLTSGYQAGMVMASRGKLTHARRICQASGVRISLRATHERKDGGYSHSYLQVDGEPWRQSVPNLAEQEPLVVEVTHSGISHMYHNYKDLDPSDVKAQQKELQGPPLDWLDSDGESMTRSRTSKGARQATQQHKDKDVAQRARSRLGQHNSVGTVQSSSPPMTPTMPPPAPHSARGDQGQQQQQQQQALQQEPDQPSPASGSPR